MTTTPTEVAIVRQSKQPLEAFVETVIRLLFGALGLMWGVPRAHDILGAPDRHPGYGACLLLVIFTSWVVDCVKPVAPTTVSK